MESTRESVVAEASEREGAGDDPPFVLRLDEGTTLRVPRDGRRVLVVSDLHLGPREPFGFPAELVPVLARLLLDAADRGDIVVLDGDIVDTGPARERARDVLGRYPRVLEALRETARRTTTIYVVGNHDPPLGEVAALDLCEVASAVVLDDVLVVHGDELDVGLSSTLVGRSGDAFARFQRLVGRRFDLPLERFDTLDNRALSAAVLRAARAVDERATDPSVRSWLDRNMSYLVSLDADHDPRFVVATLARTKLPGPFRRIVCGHTHHPGVAQLDHVEYVNAGTFSRHMATYVELDGPGVRVRDAVTGRIHGSEAYAAWREASDWRAAAAPTPKSITDLRPLVQSALDRTLGAVSRFDAHAASLRAVEAAVSVLPRATGTEGGAAGAPDEGRPLSVRFRETLRGTVRTLEGTADRRALLQLDAVAEAGDLGNARLGGSVDIDGLATRAAVEGRLRLVSRGGLALRYTIDFRADDGREFRLEGEKVPSLRDLGRSLTSLAARLSDASGETVGEAELEISTDRDLGAWIRSISVSMPAPRAVAKELVGVDHFPGGRLEQVEPARRLRVVVTGAAGHLGYNLVGQLLERGHEVCAVVRRRGERTRPLEVLAERLDRPLAFAEADVLSPAALRVAFADGADVLVHVAGSLKFHSPDDEREIVMPNVQGTIHAMRAAAHARIPKVVLTSSVAALGNDAKGREPLDERDWNRDAKSAYQRSKTAAERRAWDIAAETGTALVTIQPGTFLGPNFFRHTAATRLVAEFVAGRAPAVPPFALPWVDVRDVAWAHVLAAESAHATGRYPVVTVHLSFEELLRTIVEIDPDFPVPSRKLPGLAAAALPLFDWAQSRLLGTARVLDAGTVADTAGKELRVSAGRIRSELGWTPTAIERTVADTIGWVRERFER